jgi:hypothetical protein
MLAWGFENALKIIILGTGIGLAGINVFIESSHHMARFGNIRRHKRYNMWSSCVPVGLSFL